MIFFKNVFSFSFFTLISRIFGFIRDLVIALKLGASSGSDVFFVAAKAPNFLRAIFAEGAFTQAFLPLYNKINHKNTKTANIFANNIFLILVIVVVIFVIIVEIFMEQFCFLLAPGFASNKEKFDMLVFVSRITFPYLIFISICCLYSAILNSYHKYTPTAIVPIISNLCLIIGIFTLFDFTQDHVLSLVYAFLFSGVLQIIFLIIHIRKINKFIKPIYKSSTGNEKIFFRKIIPAIIGASLTQINLWIDMVFASLINNVVSFFNYAERLINLPIALIAISISTVLLPSLTQSIDKNDIEKIKYYNLKSLNFIFILILPASVALFILSDEIVYVLFMRGEFNIEATKSCGLILRALVFSIPAISLYRIVTCNFYARSNTKTPMFIAFFVMILNIIFNFIFMHYFSFVGIAISTSLVTWIAVILGVIYLNKKYKILLGKIDYKAYSRTIISLFLMGIALYFARDYFFISFEISELRKSIYLLIVIGVGSTVYILPQIFFFGSFAKIKAYFS